VFNEDGKGIFSNLLREGPDNFLRLIQVQFLQLGPHNSLRAVPRYFHNILGGVLNSLYDFLRF